MEMGGENRGKSPQLRRMCEKVKTCPRKMWGMMWGLGKEDPRRVIHAIKVGFALTLTSLLCLLEPLSDGIGQNAIWAVMTVVVVLEFTAGATLCKGLNRGVGTVLAGLFALLVEYYANDRPVPRAVFMGSIVFIVGSAATYMRFVPTIKKKYDYGFVVFILTFNLVLVANYRVDNTTRMARDRFFTIAIGCGICLFLTLLTFPIWSGDDLHESTIAKLEGLAQSVKGCVEEYFSDAQPQTEETEEYEDSIDTDCLKVLESKSTDESLALHASWEPRYLVYCGRSPWQQYVKLGSALRQFGYTVMALHGCLRAEIKTPLSVRGLFMDQCIRLAGEVSTALMEIANSIRDRRRFSPEILSNNLQEALHDLNTVLQTRTKLLSDTTNRKDSTVSLATCTEGDTTSTHELQTMSPSAKICPVKVLKPQRSKLVIATLEFSETLPLAAFVSLLVEAVARLDRVIEEAKKLGKIARFKDFKPGNEVVLICERTRSGFVQNYFPPVSTE